MITIVCTICKKGFKVKPYRKKTAKYCSRTCRGKAVLAMRKMRGEKIGFDNGHIPWNFGKKWPKEYLDKIRKGEYIKCLNCKEVFYRKPSEPKYNRGKYCSKVCWESSEEKKETTSRYHKGKKCPYAKPPHFSGKDHWNWQGGITSGNAKIRNSLEYRLWRQKIFERDDYTCVMCGLRGGKLHVDHIKAFSRFKELRFDINNGRTLCENCHKNTPTYLNRRWEKLYKNKILAESL